jgi:hypothetical protein
MSSSQLIAWVIAAYDGPGRGAAPDTGPGIVVILGIAVGVLAIAAAVGWWLTHRER